MIRGVVIMRFHRRWGYIWLFVQRLGVDKVFLKTDLTFGHRGTRKHVSIPEPPGYILKSTTVFNRLLAFGED